jgi:hypothetical protein
MNVSDRMPIYKNLVISFVGAAVLLSADTIILKNGNRVEGSFVGGDSRSVRFAVGTQINTYYLHDVESIRFEEQQNEPPPSNAYSQSSANTPPTNEPPRMDNPSSDTYSRASAPPPPAPPSRPPDTYGAPPRNAPPALEVPAGTQLVVRLIDSVNSERDRLGQTFRASLDQPVIVNGQTAIPRGADVIATLIDAQKSGKIQGRTLLTLDLKTITVNGRSYDIVTTGVAESSGSRGERSAKVIGGAAALGAIIGAAASGGKGAAIGAGSGAAVGTAAQVATSGQKVNVPAETRLTFTLQNPIDLQ